MSTRRIIKGTYIEGIMYAIMVGSAESFALYYAVLRGLDKTQLAFLTTMPVLMGSLVQTLIPLNAFALPLRRLKLMFFLLQAAGLATLSLSVLAVDPFLFLLVGLCLYWIGGLGAGPLWLEWIAQEVPGPVFRGYLSKRNAFVSLVTVGVYLSTGAFLHLHGEAKDFFWVFLFSATIRFLSMFVQKNISHSFLARTHESSGSGPEHTQPNLKKALIAALVVAVCFRFAVNLSSPFFIPFMVDRLGMDLLGYVVLTAIPFFGRYMFLAKWGQVARDTRPFMGLQVTALGIAFLPSLWIFAQGQSGLLYAVFEFFSGVLWGGYELCLILIIQRLWRGRVLLVQSLHAAAMNLAGLTGALVGSWIIGQGNHYELAFHWSSGLRFLLAIGLVVALQIYKPQNFRAKDYGHFLFTLMSIRPSLANIGKILNVGSTPRHKRVK